MGVKSNEIVVSFVVSAFDFGRADMIIFAKECFRAVIVKGSFYMSMLFDRSLCV